MAKILFQSKNFRQDTLALINKCNAVLTRYAAAGYDMTVRQVYYQLVAADEIENSEKSYDKIQMLLNDARFAGLVDWDHIVDRTRELRRLSTWDTPEDILESAHDGFRIDKWASQDFRPEVWIEKDALVGVFERTCNALEVPVLSCRGYASLSEMFEAGYRRFSRYIKDGQTPFILHFGDHDPSGIDMSRDILDRTSLLSKTGLPKFLRLALNMDQVDQYQPPPNPAKLSDTRARDYVIKFGSSSWELDALEPTVLDNLIQSKILDIRDDDLWEQAVEEENEHKENLSRIADNYDKIRAFLDNNGM
ncbi:MAG: hypothetical protein M3388_12315 [Acidobacteriota bacterium]|nr:hypothetical protein [Acidobacteriota bacterium]